MPPILSTLAPRSSDTNIGALHLFLHTCLGVLAG
jgi:hypothetical protein